MALEFIHKFSVTCQITICTLVFIFYSINWAHHDGQLVIFYPNWPRSWSVFNHWKPEANFSFTCCSHWRPQNVMITIKCRCFAKSIILWHLFSIFCKKKEINLKIVSNRSINHAQCYSLQGKPATVKQSSMQICKCFDFYAIDHCLHAHLLIFAFFDTWRASLRLLSYAHPFAYSPSFYYPIVAKLPRIHCLLRHTKVTINDHRGN